MGTMSQNCFSSSCYLSTVTLWIIRGLVQAGNSLQASYFCPPSVYSFFFFFLSCIFSCLPPLSLYFIYLFRHNQRSLAVQKDPVHKNRCHVRFPEVFSSYPYIVNVTAINALGKTSNTYSFEESNIGNYFSFTAILLPCTFCLSCLLKVHKIIHDTS